MPKAAWISVVGTHVPSYPRFSMSYCNPSSFWIVWRQVWRQFHIVLWYCDIVPSFDRAHDTCLLETLEIYNQPNGGIDISTRRHD